MTTQNQKQSDTWLDRNRFWILIVFIAISVAGVTVFYLQQPPQTAIEIIPASTATPPPPTPTATSTILRVYITGAIARPDVYYLPPGSIVEKLVEAAGGLTPQANAAGINQALELQDQQHIHVPMLGETPPPAAPVPGSQIPHPSGQYPVQLNSAGQEELETLPGIGPTLAQRIIDYRENIGGFSSADQLKEVSGIGDATFEKIAPLLTLE
jgi:competence protein ComEA